MRRFRRRALVIAMGGGLGLSASFNGAQGGLPPPANVFALTRLTAATFVDHELVTRNAPAGLMRMQGWRFVRNFCSGSSEDLTTGTNSQANATAAPTTVSLNTANASFFYRNSSAAAVIGRTYRARLQVSCAVSRSLLLRFTTSAAGVDNKANVTVGPTPQTFSFIFTAVDVGLPQIGLENRAGAGASDTSTGVFTVGQVQIEDVTGQSNQNPGEYVSVGVTSGPGYNGWGADGCAFYATLNGNTVAANVVTAGTGAAITDGGANTGGNGCGMMLMHEQGSRNDILWSQDFSNAAHTKSNLTVGASGTAPDGTATAQSLSATATSASGSNLLQAITISAAQQRSESLDAKYDGNNPWCCFFAIDGSGNGVRVWFNLQTGAVGTTTLLGTGWSSAGTTIDLQANGFYRLGITVNTAGTTFQCGFYPVTDADASVACTVGRSNSFWGLQNEASLGLGRPSSYIATTTVAVVRNEDTLTDPGITAAFSLQGWVEMKVAMLIAAGTTGRLIAGSVSNAAPLFANTVRPSIDYSDNSALSNGPISSALSSGVVANAASTWGGITAQAATNGVAGVVGVFASGGASLGTLLYIGRASSAANQTSFGIKKYQRGNAQLTSAQLAAVTT